MASRAREGHWIPESSRRREVDTPQGVRIREKSSQVSMGHTSFTLHLPFKLPA